MRWEENIKTLHIFADTLVYRLNNSSVCFWSVVSLLCDWPLRDLDVLSLWAPGTRCGVLSWFIRLLVVMCSSCSGRSDVEMH